MWEMMERKEEEEKKAGQMYMDFCGGFCYGLWALVGSSTTGHYSVASKQHVCVFWSVTRTS